MAKDKKSVLLYCDLIHTVNPLTDEEAGRLFKHYLAYINDLNPEPIDRLTGLIFEPIKQNLKRDLKKWEDTAQKNKDNALIRWNKNNATACDRIKTDANDAVTDTVIVTDTVKDNVKEKVFNFKSSLISLGVDDGIVNDFLLVRKTKGAANTKTAFVMLENQIKKSGIKPNEAISIAVERSWQTFKSEWYNNSIKQNTQTQSSLNLPQNKRL